jgi:hypothetical protein
MQKSIIALLTIALALAVWGDFYKPASGQTASPVPTGKTDGNPVGFRLKPNMQLDQVIGTTRVTIEGPTACLKSNKCKFVGLYFRNTSPSAACTGNSCTVANCGPGHTCVYLTSSGNGLAVESYSSDKPHGPEYINANLRLVLAN